MDNCIFCKIIKGEIPADKIYEDEAVFAFMDIRPVARGHLLVIPKQHSTDITDTADDVLNKTIDVTRKIAQAVLTATSANGFTITTNKGEAAGQTVFHVHFHVIPRYSGDGLKPWVHHEIEPKTRAELAEKIKKLL